MSAGQTDAVEVHRASTIRVPVTLDEARDPPASAYDHAGLARP